MALAVIMVAFAVRYLNARNGEEKGTQRDDSPAAEAGVRKADGASKPGSEEQR